MKSFRLLFVAAMLFCTVGLGTAAQQIIVAYGSGNQVNWQDLDLTGVQKIILHADGTADLE